MREVVLVGFTSIPIRNIIHEAVARGGIIVDVRTREEFAAGHIPMAINVPLEQIEEGAYSLPKSKYLIVYCERGDKQHEGSPCHG